MDINEYISSLNLFLLNYDKKLKKYLNKIQQKLQIMQN